MSRWSYSVHRVGGDDRRWTYAITSPEGKTFGPPVLGLVSGKWPEKSTALIEAVERLRKLKSGEAIL